MYRDFIEEELSRRSVFKSEEILSIDYVPENLPHREKELRLLAQSFRTLLTAPGQTSHKFVIEGPVGTGKTAVAKRFAEMMVQAAKPRRIRLHSIHINCRVSKSTYMVYLRILREFKPKFPRRGHSPEELLQIMVETLDDEDFQIIMELTILE